MNDSEQDFRWREIPEEAIESWWQAADGWDIRRIDWLPLDPEKQCRGALLFLPGRGDHYEKYIETLHFWAEQGWRVTSIDWRGQGLSGRLVAGSNAGHIDDFSTWIADLGFFWDKWKSETPGPHVVVAHSMGGHLAMRALTEGAIDPIATILSAPMFGIRSNGFPISWSHVFAKWMVWRGKGEKTAWKEAEMPKSPFSLRRKILTHSKRRYDDEMVWWDKRPEVKLGPSSWQWVERAIASTRILAEDGRLETVHCPILLLAAKADQLVNSRRIAKDHQRLPNSQMLCFGLEAAHELLREVDAVRDRCLETATEFLDKHAPNP